MSALTGENVDMFVSALFNHLPAGPAYYPEDQLSDQPERAIAAEMIREKLIMHTRDELPYSTAVFVDRFEEGDTLHRIHATIVVERESQKPIIIGKGGELLKRIGTAARLDLERFFGRKMYLELRVKVEKSWRDDEDALRRLGLAER